MDISKYAGSNLKKKNNQFLELKYLLNVSTIKVVFYVCTTKQC